MEQGAAQESASRPIAELSAAESLVTRLMAASSLALDTEGDGMFRYRTSLCTVQLAGAGEIAVVDTLAVPPAPLFCELLGERGPEKIIHDASFDARVLFAHGVKLARVFDTAVAARFLGLPSTGLSALLLRYFGLHLPKHRQMADWGLRPIDGDAMRYLEDDVRYLPELAERLLSEIRAADIESEVRVECEYVLGEAQRNEAPEPPWMRIKGAALRTPKERARLFELAEVRESLAREHDLPPARLLSSELLLSIAREAPKELAQLASMLGSRAELAEALLPALARAEQHEDAPPEHVRKLLPPPPSPSELARRKRRKALLMDFREKQAKERGVDVQVVLPGHCVSELVDLPELSAETLATVPGFGPCRVDRYAAQLAALEPRWRE